ncbi:MAG: fibronectin type III domain-containing protein [Coriobacteriia bacterium]|nr:fibronectin type III domain-containing protein [Coriobacteriia bacterium]
MARRFTADRKRATRVAVALAAALALVCLIPIIAAAIAPTPPSSLLVTPGDEAPVVATLEWIASTDPQTTGYLVYVSIDPANGPFQLIAKTTGTSAVYDTGIPGIGYYFRVVAVNALGDPSSAAAAGPVAAMWAQSPHITPGVDSRMCMNCHSVHEADPDTSLYRWEVGASQSTIMCLTCHDGRNSNTANVASGTSDAFGLASGHRFETTPTLPASISGCDTCHAVHGSSLDARRIPAETINGTSVASAGNEMCYACHTTSGDWYGTGYPSTSSPTRDTTGYPIAGTWPGPTTYDSESNLHRLIPETTQTPSAGSPIRRGAGDCLYCHASHRGANVYDGLLATFRPSSASTLASDQANGTYAAACLNCHGNAIPSGFATAPVNIEQFVTGGDATAGHRVITSGGDLPIGAPLPCYECHNPHGSKRGNASMISDERGRSLATTDTSSIRHFCFTCHTTSDSASGWDSVGEVYTPVSASDFVVGLRRDGTTGEPAQNVLRLPSTVSAHLESSGAACYTCHGDGYGSGQNNVHAPSVGDYEATIHTGVVASQTITITSVSYGPLECSDCHDLELGAEHEKPSSSSTAAGCANCHPSPRNTLTSGWSATSCVEGGCHVVGSATEMHAGVDAAHEGQDTAACDATGCHVTNLAVLHSTASTTVPNPAALTVRIDVVRSFAGIVRGLAGEGTVTYTGCGVCHGPSVPTTRSCLVCHAGHTHIDESGLTEGNSHTATPASETITISSVTYGPYECSMCHEMVVNYLTASTGNAGHLQTDGCATCHPTPKNTLIPQWNHGCVQGGCHTVGSPEPMHDSLDASHSPSPTATCLAAGCHEDLASVSVATMHSSATTTVAGVTYSSCTICHGDRRNSTEKVPTKDCSAAECHADHAPYTHGYTDGPHTGAQTGTITINPASYPQFVITGVECSDCHGTFQLGPQHANSCTTCHTAIVPDSFTTWTGECDQAGCHSSLDVNPVHAGIDTTHSMDPPEEKDCFTAGVCHTAGSLPAIHSTASTTTAGTTYTGCQVCHRNSTGKVQPADPTDCLSCHAERLAEHGWTAEQHTSNVETATADIVSNGVTHADVACRLCHKALISADAGTVASGTVDEHMVKQGLDCGNCHPSPRDMLLATGWDRSCSQGSCHTVDSNSPQHASIDASHQPPAGIRCMAAGCHLTDSLAPTGVDLADLHKDATTTVNSQVVSSCMVCHFNNEYRPDGPTSTPTFQTDIAGVPDTIVCDTCHPEGNNTMHGYIVSVHTATPASQTISIATPSLDDTVTYGPMPCSRCHYMDLAREHGRNGSAYRTVGCANCHPDPESSLAPLGGWEVSSNRNCVDGDCHTAGGPTAKHRNVDASHTVLPANSGCMAGNACHTNSGNNLPQIHSVASTVTAGGTTLTDCDVCHGGWTLQSAPPSANCLVCHSAKASAHVNTDTLHPTTTATACSSDEHSCHYLTLAREHLRRTPSAGGTFTCETCHTYSGSDISSRTIAAIRSNDTNCYTCHLYTPYHGAEPVGNTQCQSCHGATSAAMSAVSTAGAYANTAGDHETTYTTSAHSTVDAGSQAIQCTVCHDHTLSTPKAIEYRSQVGKPDPNGNHEDLCFICHSENGEEAGKPNTWNGRDIQTEFLRPSKHTLSAGGGSYVDQEQAAWSESTAASFTAEAYKTRVQVTNVSGGEVKLAEDPSDAVNPGAQADLIFARNGATTRLDQYKIASGSWNSSNTAVFTPTAAPSVTASGSSAFRLPGDPGVYFTQGGTANVLRYAPPADPAADAWTTSTVVPGGVLGVGADSAVNSTGTATTGRVVYFTRGGTQNSIYWRDYVTPTNAGLFAFQNGSGTSTTLGQGSAMAFSPSTNKLFVLAKNGTTTGTGRGVLFYRTGVNRTTTSSAFTGVNSATAVFAQVASTNSTRMSVVTTGGVDTLLTLGPNAAGAITLQVVTNLASTPATINIGIKAPTGWTTTGEGMDLMYNPSDGYLYAIRGGGTAGFARIRVPANPGLAASWTGIGWETLTALRAWGGGSSIATASADPVNQVVFKYYTSGSMGPTADILPASGSQKWGHLTFSATVPTSTAFSVKVEGYNGATWDTLVTSATVSGTDLRAYSTTAYTRLRLTGSFETTAPTVATPILSDWAVTSYKSSYVPPSGSMVSCENCHNTHKVASGGTSPWASSRLSDPSNTKITWSGTVTDFCLKCHTGPSASAVQSYTPTISATQLIPYPVAFRTVTSPLFPGWSKATTGFAYKNSGHFTTTSTIGAALCQNCHDPHGSQSDSLQAWTPTSSPTAANARQNTTTATSEEGLCYKCHGTGTGTAGGRSMNVQTPASAAYNHSVAAQTGRHSDEETVGAFANSATRHVECVDCHNPHASVAGTHTINTSNAGGALKGAIGIVPPAASGNWSQPTTASYTATTMAGTVPEAYLCFKCHAGPGVSLQSVTTTSGTYTRTDLGQEFNPSNYSFHNVSGQTTAMKTSFTFVNVAGTTVTQTWPLPTTAWLKTLEGVQLTSNSKITCSDCHTGSTTTARGPHGSAAKWMVDPAYPNEWSTITLTNRNTTTTPYICQKCHNFAVATNNVHQSNHDSYACRTCHVSVPHGWKRPRLMAYTTDTGLYEAGRTGPGSTGLTGIKTGWTTHTLTSGSVQWAEGDCYADCSTSRHSASTAIMP